MTHLITLDDVTPNRATVTAVHHVTARDIEPNRETGRSPITTLNYAIVTDPELVPDVGERVWLDDGATRSGGERVITARG